MLLPCMYTVGKADEQEPSGKCVGSKIGSVVVASVLAGTEIQLQCLGGNISSVAVASLLV